MMHLGKNLFQVIPPLSKLPLRVNLEHHLQLYHLSWYRPPFILLSFSSTFSFSSQNLFFSPLFNPALPLLLSLCCLHLNSRG